MVRKHRFLYIALLTALIVNLLFCAYAHAETNDSETSGSDCGCSESGSSASYGEASGRDTGYAAPAGGTVESGQQDGFSARTEGGESVNLIWVNLITIAVVAAIVVMLVRYRKSVKKEQDTEKEKVRRPDSAYRRTDRMKENQHYKREL